MTRELKDRDLRATVDPATLAHESTADVEPRDGIIGQERAISALRFGLEIQERGFNVYVAGLPGVGKMTAVRTFATDQAAKLPVPDDWCYVNNFDDPYQPQALRLPPGRANELRHDMQNLIEHIRNEVPRAFESEDYVARRDGVVKQLEKQRAELLEKLNEEVMKAGFAVHGTRSGMILIPVIGGRPLNEEEFRDLPESAREELDQKKDALQDRLKAAMRQVRELTRATLNRLRELNESVALYMVGGLIDDLCEKYNELPEVLTYLTAVQKDIVQHIESFRDESEDENGQKRKAVPRPRKRTFRKYQVNVVTENGGLKGAPIVFELNPTFVNLIGRVEKEAEFGALHTDFTMIRGGALHRANGGFLVLTVLDLFREGFSWDGLKRALRTGEIQIEELADRLGLVTTKTLKPEPIPLQIKVVLVGHPLHFIILHAYDESFPELFKVKVDFDTRMPREGSHIEELWGFLRCLCDREKIRPLTRDGVAKLLEFSSRIAEDQEKLSTHLGLLADVVREAGYWAAQAGSDTIGATHVKRAVDERVYRSNLIEEHVREMITRGTLLIDTKDAVRGQVNGLSVMSLGNVSFGKPSRITASIAAGRDGVVDIEREVKLGGPIHSKGVLILNGYLAQKYAQDGPLSLSARLVFEQSYTEVDGDSASSAELYALLSALADAPLHQGIAVTGSINQRGELQAIGGVNEKIEGFFDVCRASGLTGDQGVLIPVSNAVHLMLREDVVEAITAGRFHVWTASTIEEGVELLTGAPAGERLNGGSFKEGTLNHRIEARLASFTESMRRMHATAS